MVASYVDSHLVKLQIAFPAPEPLTLLLIG